MKPIGTITAFFPFMEKDTKTTIESIMKDAYNFRGFVTSLSEEVCSRSSPDQTVFFAIHFAALLFDFRLLDMMAKEYGKLPIIRPNLFYGSAIQGRREDFAKVREAADEVLSSYVPEWLRVEMQMIKIEADSAEYPTTREDPSLLDDLESFLEANLDFDFYKSRLYDNLSIRAIRDGDIDQALQLNKRALENAKKHDDVNRYAHLLRSRADYLQSSKRTESLNLLLQSRKLMEEMGERNGLSSVLFQLGKLESIRGNYDIAIEYNLECVEIRESLGISTGLYALTLSTLFNVVGDFESGHEWALMAENELVSQPMLQPRAYLNQAWSLILQKKPEEAHELVDEAKELILKSGLEANLGWLYFVTSIIEAKEGFYASAITNVEESLDIYERNRGYVSYYICLQHRARMEVITTMESLSLQEEKVAQNWLHLLEEKSRTEELPGILASTLLLKGELLVYQGYLSNAMITLEEAGSLVETHRLEYLKPRLKHLLSSLE